jgi:hypothetical protein
MLRYLGSPHYTLLKAVIYCARSVARREKSREGFLALVPHELRQPGPHGRGGENRARHGREGGEHHNPP